MNKELEEAVTFLKKMSKEYRIFGDLDNPDFEDTDKIYNNLDAVLNYIDNSISVEAVKEKILELWQKCPRNSVDEFMITERDYKIEILKEILENEQH